MSAGKLDQRIRIEARSSVPDGYGGSTESWALVATVWADAWPVSGRERAEAQQLEASTMVRFKIRRRSGISASMRVVWLGRAHNVLVVADAGAREPFMTLNAEAGVAI